MVTHAAKSSGLKSMAERPESFMEEFPLIDEG
jgi:hypothetical protein